VILQAKASTIDLPADRVATIVVVHARSPSGKIKRSTAMMRVSEGTAAKPPMNDDSMFGLPVYWWSSHGTVQVWPAANREYDIEVMGRDGKPIGGNRAPVSVPVVETMIAALNQAHEQQKKEQTTPQRVERFTMVGDE
jgi:hypothetical protein